MMEENNQLLLKELCARLPYGVKIECEGEICGLSCCSSDCVYIEFPDGEIIVPRSVDKVKPYLFPFSSMTIKQKAELSILVENEEGIFKSVLIEVEFYNKYHVDYRGLIEQGLAIDATELNVYSE